MPTVNVNAWIQPSDFVKTETLNIKSLLETRLFHIPDYQRAYSWDAREQVHDLWSDLREVTDRSWIGVSKSVDHPRPHFFGPLVLQRNPTGANLFDVIDGQQRLVTFSIFTRVIMDHLDVHSDEERRSNLAAMLKTSLITYGSDGSVMPRIRLSHASATYFNIACASELGGNRVDKLNKIRRRKSLRATDRALIEAYFFLKNEVEQFISSYEDPATALDCLRRSATELSIFLVMEVPDISAAYEVFEGLNARGLPLSQADLIKNKVLEQARASDLLPKVLKLWNSACDEVDQQEMIDMTQFLHFDHTIHYRTVKPSRLYSCISNDTLKQHPVDTYAFNVNSSAKHLRSILEGSSSFSEDTNGHIQAIRVALKNRFALMLLIAGANRFELHSEDFDNVARLAHHFAFRRFVVEKATLSTYESEVATAAHMLAMGDEVVNVSNFLLMKSTDAAFATNFETASASTNKLGFYVCEKLERFEGSKAGVIPKSQSPKQHLEHIFPKNPKDGEWPDCNEDERKSFVDRYGNLIILEANINATIKNRAYSYKRSNQEDCDYEHSALKMPRGLYKFETSGAWTVESIDARQKFIARELAARVWRLTL